MADRYTRFTVKTYGWPVDGRGCGRGLLDNVRGQAGSGEGNTWKCDYPAGDQAVTRSTFRIGSAVDDPMRRVQDAIYLASPGGHWTGVVCVPQVGGWTGRP